MANAGTVEVAITAGISGLQQGLAEAEKALLAAAPVLGKAALVVGTAIAAGIAASLKAAAESEQAIMALGMALRNAGDSSRASLRDLLEFNSALERHSRFTDEEIANAQALLVQQGLHGDVLKRTTQAVVDLATRTGNLSQAAMLMGNAYEGSGTGLRRFGIILEEGTPKALMFEQALAQIEQKLGGRAAAEADLLGGKFDQLTKMLGNAAERIGNILAPAVKDIIDYLLAHRDDLFDMADKIGEKLVAVLNTMRDIVNFFSAHSAVLKGLIGGAVAGAGVGALVGGIGAVPGAIGGGLLGMMGGDLYEGFTGQAQGAPGPKPFPKAFKPGQPDGMPEIPKAGTAGQSGAVSDARKFQAAWLEAYKQVFSGADVMTHRLASMMKGFISSLSQGISGFFRDILINGKNLGEALQNIGQALLGFVFDAIAKMLAEWIAKHIVMAAISKLFNLNVTKDKIAASVAQVAINKATALAEIPAIIGLTNAFLVQAYAPIPFVGPILSAAAIVEADAKIAGFASLIAAAEGGIFDKPTAILGGEAGREAMVPLTGSRGKAALREIGEGAAAAAGGGGGGVHLHIHGTLVEGDEAKWDKLARTVLVPALERQGRKSRRTTGKFW